RLAAVGVDESRAHVGILRGKEPLHAVSTHAVVAIAYAPAEGIQVCGRMDAIDDQEIIAAGRRLGERDHFVLSLRCKPLNSFATDPCHAPVTGGSHPSPRKTGACWGPWPRRGYSCSLRFGARLDLKILQQV